MSSKPIVFYFKSLNMMNRNYNETPFLVKIITNTLVIAFAIITFE